MTLRSGLLQSIEAEKSLHGKVSAADFKSLFAYIEVRSSPDICHLALTVQSSHSVQICSKRLYYLRGLILLHRLFLQQS
jgi:hypothetical protein